MPQDFNEKVIRDPSGCGKDDDRCGEGSKVHMCSVVEQFPGLPSHQQ